jgi:hypothetical protein
VGPGAIDKVGARCRRAFSGSARDRVKSLNCLVSSAAYSIHRGTYLQSRISHRCLPHRGKGHRRTTIRRSFLGFVLLVEFWSFFVLISGHRF